MCFVRINRESCTICHFIRNLWKEPSANFIDFIWNDHDYKILFIIWRLKKGILFLRILHYFGGRHSVVTDGVVALRASGQMLCGVWSRCFCGMALATKWQWRHMVNDSYLILSIVCKNRFVLIDFICMVLYMCIMVLYMYILSFVCLYYAFMYVTFLVGGNKEYLLTYYYMPNSMSPTF